MLQVFEFSWNMKGEKGIGKKIKGTKGILDNPLKIEFSSLSKSEIDDFHVSDILIISKGQ